jgi:S1-C subfamily serine protease
LAVGLLAFAVGYLCAEPFGAAIDAVALFKKADPAVVVLLALGENGQLLRQGSGFIVDGGTAIVTNYHVIAGATKVAVKTSAGDTFAVNTALGIDEKTDVAVLRTQARQQLVALQLADSSLVKVGEDVAAIGSPQGLENTISTGIVSGLRRLSDELSYIQMTAPISPGSSGGPLLNAAGEVIGITTFLVRGGQNLNFCIPINYAKRIISQPKSVTLVALARSQGNTSSLLGLWSYDTICHSCETKRATGTIRITAAEGHLLISGQITYTNGVKFAWTELAYTDGSTIWGYAVNDWGHVGTHVYQIEDGEMTSSWMMSNGAFGTSVSKKLRPNLRR